MWILLWLVLSGFILGFFFWSSRILFLQKKAWAAFARKRNLSFEGGKFSDSPVMRGRLDAFAISLYTSARETNDVRGQRYMTVLEIELGKGMPTGAAISVPQLSFMTENLAFAETFSPDSPGWKPEYVIRARDVEKLKAYLTSERLKTLSAIFSIKGCSALFIFDELEAVLRLETSDPMINAEKLDKMVGQLIVACRKLALTPDEKSAAAASATALPAVSVATAPDSAVSEPPAAQAVEQAQVDVPPPVSEVSSAGAGQGEAEAIKKDPH